MNEDELFDALEKVNSSDPDLANRMYDLWNEDRTRDLGTLRKLAGVGFGERVKKENSGVRKPVNEAFGISEDGFRLLVDPNSEINWTTLPSKELLKAAIDAGYVEDVPKNAPEEKKQEQRENFGAFLNMLAGESTLQGRRNAIREYEKTGFVDDPLGWAEKGLNNTLFRTYAKRAKEQAMKGQGAASYGDLSSQDLATIGGDVAVNSMLGAGAGGISASLLGRGVGYGGLRTFGNVAGSDFAAGVLGGLGSAANRDVNTDDGARWYEYATEPAMTGALNVLATPSVMREGVSNAARLVGLGGAKVGGMGKRNALQTAQRIADEKYAEPALAARMREMEADIARTYENSPVTEETRAKVANMFDVLNDGVTSSPGKSTSLFDDLQALYEKSGRDKFDIRTNDVLGQYDMSVTPRQARFSDALDKKISELEGMLKNEAGKTESPELVREIKYFKNFRDMVDNGLIDARSYLHNTEPVAVPAPKSNYVLNDRTADVPFFELGKKTNKEDLDFIRDYVRNVNSGNNIAYDGELALRVRELADKYPEFARYVQSQRMVPGPGMSLWPSRGVTVERDFGAASNRTAVPEVLVPENAVDVGGASVPGFDFAKSGRRSYGHANSRHGGKWTAGDVLRASGYGARDVAMDLVKPAIVEARLMAHDKPDNSLETLTEKYEKLRKEKPEAVDAAMNWKFDPHLESSRQLTSEERDLLDRFRTARRNAILGED